MVTRTQFDGQTQIQAGTITRADLNTATTGSAVITKLIVSSGGAISFKTYTGADSGTGDVTLTDNAVQYGAQTLTAAQQAQVQTNVGLGTLAKQNAASAALTGGTIDGTTIGGTTPAVATATWLTFSGSSANYNGAFPSSPAYPQNGQSQFGWNWTQGAGELDLFINRGNGNGGGLQVYDVPNGSQAVTLIMSVSGAGAGYFPSLTLGAALPIASGGTGSTTAAGARAALGTGQTGSTVIDFGTAGSTNVSTAITGQSAIIASSVVDAWIVATASADHSADEHLVEVINVMAGAIVAGTGFTIFAVTGGLPLYGKWSVNWSWN